MTNYLVSEMVLADEQSPYTKEEQQAIVECAVPVYTTAQSYIQKGVDAEYIMKLAQSYIGKVFSSKNIKTAVGLAAVILAVKTVWSLAMLAVTGAIAVVGTSILWSLCKKLRESFSSSESTKSVYEMLKKKVESLREQYQKYERRSKYRNDQKEKEHWMQEKWEEDSEDWQEEENNDVF